MDGLEWVEVTVRIPAKTWLTESEVKQYLGNIGDAAFEMLMDTRLFPRPMYFSKKNQLWLGKWVTWFLDSRDILPRCVSAENYSPESAGLDGNGPGSGVFGRDRGSKKESG